VKFLRKGDVLYWHQLKRSGEIPGVREDVRARPQSQTRSRSCESSRSECGRREGSGMNTGSERGERGEGGGQILGRLGVFIGGQ